jgi:esterase
VAALTLDLREYGEPAEAPPVLLLHGLFGSAANWHGIAKRLAEDHWVLVPDLRNHGRSPRSDQMTYPAMAEDLLALLDQRDIRRAVVVGHSMGGKAAMWLALSQPKRVEALGVADISPASYPHRFDAILDALEGLELEHLADRREADARLAAALPSPALRDYLLQNLAREGDAWYWRINLPVLRASMEEIVGFPDTDGRQFAGPTLFIYGTGSDYVTGAHLPAIRALFRHARLRVVPNAGHWVYAEQPEAFTAALQGLFRD